MEASKRFRVVSMDGGGIYGYTSARLLEALCRGDEHFMAPGQRVNLFAGTSAGALNALLLAVAEDPRQFVLDGGLRRFWARPELFSNQANPWDAWTSLFGITAWLGTEDFKQVLRETFGDKTLADVRSHVLVTTWMWSGTPSHPTWRPTIFSDRIAQQRDRSLVDIAYGSAAPSPLRAVFGGLGDGGYFAPNPSMYAYTFATHTAGMFADSEDFDDFVGVTGENIALLSVGTGVAIPAYFLRDFNFGYWPFSMVPTNPGEGNWFAPSIQLALDAPGESETLLSEELMGGFYFRLNPPLLKPPWAPPTLVAAGLARYQVWQSYLLQIQDHAMTQPEASEAVDEAATYLKSRYWTGL